MIAKITEGFAAAIHSYQHNAQNKKYIKSIIPRGTSLLYLYNASLGRK